MPFSNDPSEVGVLWSNMGGRGEYLSGTINGVKVVCFHNDKSLTNPRIPKWTVKIRTPKDTTPPERPVEPPDDAIPF